MHRHDESISELNIIYVKTGMNDERHKG
jgi:hypothetical protein